MKKHYLVIILFIIGFAGWWAYLVADTKRSPTDLDTKARLNRIAAPVRVGIIAPLTGDLSSLGVAFHRSALIAQREINSTGGIAGRELVFIAEDAKCEPALAASAAQKLIHGDHIKVIFGGMCSGEMLAAAPIAEDAGVLIISPSATSPDITHAGSYVFRTVSSDVGQGTVGAEYAYHTLRARTAAVISEQTDYAQGLRRVFVQRFKELGGLVLADEVFQTHDSDMRSQMYKIKHAQPDLVYILPQTPVTATLLAQQFHALEVSAQRLGSEANITRDALAADPTFYAGIIATEPYFDELSTHAAQFLSTYEDVYKEKPVFPSMMANMYSQTYLIKEGVEKVGDDPRALRDWLSSVQGWRHALGELTFTPEGDRIGAYSVKEVQHDGSLKELGVVKPE